MKRRDFIRNTTLGLGAAWLGGKTLSETIWALPPLPQKFRASDTIVLGQTGIKTSRLAMGTGTVGFGGRSNQTQLGLKGLSGLLLNGYENGLRFFDAAEERRRGPSPVGALAECEHERNEDHREEDRAEEVDRLGTVRIARLSGCG